MEKEEINGADMAMKNLKILVGNLSRRLKTNLKIKLFKAQI
jgi:hypothetical protein